MLFYRVCELSLFLPMDVAHEFLFQLGNRNSANICCIDTGGRQPL